MNSMSSHNGPRPANSQIAFRSTDADKRSDLARMKTVAITLLVTSVLIAMLSRTLTERHWIFAYVAAWAEAAAIGGLADWYAVVALFRHPMGIPMPHSAIVATNRVRIAESFGIFVHDQFLQPEPIAERLHSVDFAALAAEWIADGRRSAVMSAFILKVAPEAVVAVEETGLKDFMAGRALEQLKSLELAPFVARFLTGIIEDGRHQRLFDELLVGLHRFLSDEETLDAIREKVRRELPLTFNLLRADAYLVRRFVTLVSQAIDEAKENPEHPFRRDFDRFAQEFVEKLSTSTEYAERAEKLKQELLARPELGDLAESLWRSFTKFLEEDAQSGRQLLQRHMADFLVDVGRKLALEPTLRADINAGVVKALQIFIEGNRQEVARFVADQIKSWDIERMTDIIELNIGRDLQYIRLNGTFVGGLAGLGLFALEHAAHLI